MALAGLAGSVVSSAIGAWQSSKANREARNLLQGQIDQNRRWYDQRMSEDYTSRSDFQNILNQQRDLFQQNFMQARATNAVAGGTDAQLAMQKESANKASADVMRSLAGQAAQYKEGVENAYMNANNNLIGQMRESYSAQGNNIAQAAGAATQAFGNLMVDYNQSSTKGTK